MPHSTDMASTASPSVVKDEPMEDEPSSLDNVALIPENGDVDMVETATSKKDVKLEDLFVDMDSDDEFPSSAPAPASQKAALPSSPQAPISVT